MIKKSLVGLGERVIFDKNTEGVNIDDVKSMGVPYISVFFLK